MKALSIFVGLVFIFLAFPCIHWGITVHDTASGLSVIVGLFLAGFGAKLIYLATKGK